MTLQQELPFPAENSADPIDAADEWLVYLYSGQVSEAGKVAFRAWLAQSPEHVQAYKDAEQLWRDIGLCSLPLAEQVELSSGLNAEPEVEHPQPQPRAAIRNRFAALAASLALIASTAVWWFEQDTQVATTRYVSHTAQTRTITLEDNSKVVLSADSSLTVSFNQHARSLNLLRGRAYFDVSPDPSRPFVVRAGNATATAVGTAFDVNSDDEGVTVSVTHGIVDVKSYANAQSEPQLALRKINAGQMVRADKQGVISNATAFDIDDVLAWRSGRLVYQGEKLSVITAEINRYRTKKIRLLDKTLRDKRITLSVAADKTEQLIAAIQVAEAVHIVDTPTEILISKAKPY